MDFLKSKRFWAMILTAVAVYLSKKEIIGQDEMILISTITGGFWGTQTVDKIYKSIEENNKMEG